MEYTFYLCRKNGAHQFNTCAHGAFHSGLRVLANLQWGCVYSSIRLTWAVMWCKVVHHMFLYMFHVGRFVKGLRKLEALFSYIFYTRLLAIIFF